MADEEEDLLTIAYLDGFHKRDAEMMLLRVSRDEAYKERNLCVVGLAKLAVKLGYNAGLGQHVDEPGRSWDDDWRTIVFIDFPTGQCSWHIHDSEKPMFEFLPTYDGTWDGHSTEEKYNRLLEC